MSIFQISISDTYDVFSGICTVNETLKCEAQATPSRGLLDAKGKVTRAHERDADFRE